VHALVAAGEDDAARRELADVGFVAVPGVDFAIDADFPDAAGDELGVLGTEVQDEDFLGMDVLHGGYGCFQSVSRQC